MKKGLISSSVIVCVGLLLAIVSSSYNPINQHDVLVLMAHRVMIFFKALLFPLGVAALLKYLFHD